MGRADETVFLLDRNDVLRSSNTVLDLLRVRAKDCCWFWLGIAGSHTVTLLLDR